jgi:hypothetical protein
MDYIKTLQAAIKRLHGCDSEHVESVSVVETFRGKTIWQGLVEVFNLIRHPKAKRCYAWANEAGKTGKDVEFVAVLEVPPVKDARTAVQASIVAANKK